LIQSNQGFFRAFQTF